MTETRTDWRSASVEKRHAYERKVWGPWAAKYADDRRLRITGDLVEYFESERHAEGRAILRALGDLAGRKVLECGCGPGTMLPLLARCGSEVWAFDLVPEVVEVARRCAQINGVADRVHVDAASFEEMPYGDEAFDRVVGFGVLHHVNLSVAARQVHRVLKPGGVAVFSEPLGNNLLLEFARKHLLYPGKEEHGTDVPLTDADVTAFAAHFSSHRVEPFYFFAMIEQALGRLMPNSIFRRTDAALLRRFPGLGRYYRMAVMTFTK